MALYEDGSYSSASGIALIAKVLAGRCAMNYTRAAVGKGTIPEGESPKTMTAPADYVMDAQISAITNPVDGECQVTVQINSSNVTQGFYLTNIVLFAEDPDEGEVAYTYLSLENEPEWIRPASSTVGKLATFDLIAAVGDVDTVHANIDPDAIVTAAQVQHMIDEHNTDPDAHGGIGSAILIDLTIPVSGWTADGDEFCNDVAVESATAELYPSVTVNRESLAVAKAAGLCPTVQITDGAMRFWSETVPAEDLSVTAALFSKSGAATGSAE